MFGDDQLRERGIAFKLPELNQKRFFQITAAYTGGGGSFVTSGLDVSPWLYTAGVGLFGMRTESLDLSLNYDLEASPSGFLNQMGSLVLKTKI